ncbi:MAG: hypothetical protein LBB63_03105 [Holosporaceae bacterium]|jgi:hypothetical protein|nr:hypothetical protein [Holosporaceae bacterium]
MSKKVHLAALCLGLGCWDVNGADSASIMWLENVKRDEYNGGGTAYVNYKENVGKALRYLEEKGKKDGVTVEMVELVTKAFLGLDYRCVTIGSKVALLFERPEWREPAQSVLAKNLLILLALKKKDESGIFFLNGHDAQEAAKNAYHEEFCDALKIVCAFIAAGVLYDGRNQLLMDLSPDIHEALELLVHLLEYGPDRTLVKILAKGFDF